ncbi:MAG: phosphotransferase [Planctomycetota bacterium]|jgi:aminoglycoside/choline kinase family phosphotransferase
MEEVDVPGLDENQSTVSKWLLVLSPDVAPLPTTRFLEQRGVRVPQLGPTMSGAYLVEDLGDKHLVHEPSLLNYNQLLDQWQPFAFEPLPSEHPNTAFALDQDLFERELNMFQDRYLQAFRGRDVDELAARKVPEACTILAAQAARGPTCLQHRDFHSRNILVLEDGGLAWIDHQDLRRGPLFYDLASLYTDAYVDLSDQVYHRLRGEVEPLGLCFGLTPEAASERFQITALQRVLKALGTFGKLLVDGRSDYAEAESRARGMALALLDQQDDFTNLREAIA